MGNINGKLQEGHLRTSEAVVCVCLCAFSVFLIISSLLQCWNNNMPNELG